MKKPRTTTQIIEERLNYLSPKVLKVILLEIENTTCFLLCQHCSARIWFLGNLDSQVPDTFNCPICESVNEEWRSEL